MSSMRAGCNRGGSLVCHAQSYRCGTSAQEIRKEAADCLWAKISRTSNLRVVACLLSFLYAVEGKAQLQLSCQSPTVCTSATAPLGIQLTLSPLPNFTIISTGTTGLGTDSGTVFLAALVPNTITSTLSFTVNGNSAETAVTYGAGGLYSTLETPDGENVAGVNDPDISSYLNATNFFLPAGAQATAYTVYELVAGTVPSGGSLNFAVNFGGISKFAVGTIFAAFLEDDSNGQTVNATNLSGDILVMPEPGSMLLFGSGLLALGVLIRCRRAG